MYHLSMVCLNKGQCYVTFVLVQFVPRCVPAYEAHGVWEYTLSPPTSNTSITKVKIDKLLREKGIKISHLISKNLQYNRYIYIYIRVYIYIYTYIYIYRIDSVYVCPNYPSV
jgi:hypothetical protein